MCIRDSPRTARSPSELQLPVAVKAGKKFLFPGPCQKSHFGAALTPVSYTHLDGLWTPFSALPVVLIYNTKLVSPGQLTCWEDLFSPAWQGRIAFCDPSVSGSSFTGLVTLLQAVGGAPDEVLQAFAVSLDGRQLETSGEVLDSVAEGTDLVGITLEELSLIHI